MSTSPRIATGVPGLDAILEGGLAPGSVYMLIGRPGVGKTILANQLCYHQATHGRRAVFFTLLTESHAGMLAHLRRMTFFTEAVVGDSMVYFSGYKVLEDAGLAGLARLVGKAMTDRSPSLVVIDGFGAVSAAAEDGNETKQLVRQLQAFSASVGCATVLISCAGADLVQPEHTIVDGVIELSQDLNGQRTLRHLQVRKLRGGRPITGRHTVEITDAGLAVHPRFEADLENRDPSERPRPMPRVRHGDARVCFGIPGLDAMMRGGPVVASTTMLLGCSGAGKTTLALSFLAAGAAAGEPGLFFGMYEQPEDLIDKCGRLGIPLQAGIDAGKIEMLWERPIEGVLDVLADRLLAHIRRLGVKRLVIDGMHSLFRTVDFPDRMRAVSAALAEALTAFGVTTVYTLEAPDILHAGSLRVPISDLSAICQNLIAVRMVDRGDQVDRVLTVLKMRDSDHDRSVREMMITDHGIVIGSRARLHRRGRGRE
ncbi:MAG TPA: ATPase domain-containing protein [Kofleriaceae bacterium]|nr:ATPase domain-containing protein [Kofleriaceae bacterium]